MENVKWVEAGTVSSDPLFGSPREFLQSCLRDRSAASDERWRRWCADLVFHGRLGPADLLDWWTAIGEFDQVLAQYAAEPVTVPDATVVVAGSGKERFKTFNVSTAAAILAAAAGTPVVKGISRSVSAVSGAADILDVLGVTPVAHPAAIPHALERYNIAFVAYPLFCPRYADRADGVFDTISPASFFMPVATLCVRASRFVLGLAHADVALSALAVGLIRPDVTTGVVVSTDLSSGETVDEYSEVGTVRLARVATGGLDCMTIANAEPTRRWRRAVAHQPTHRGNAALVAEALASTGDTPCTRLVELNASLIVGAISNDCRPDEATDRVHRARRSGRAMRLGAWNSRNVAWSTLVQVRDQMFAFLVALGVDRDATNLRSHLDHGNLVRAGRVARYLSRADFQQHRESLQELYADHGLLGSEIGVVIDSLYTVADVLGPFDNGAEHVLMVSGMAEAYFTDLARLVLQRQADAGELSLGWKGSIGALYFRVLEGLAGYPKMSKSIPASSINLNMTPDEVTDRVMNDDETSQRAILSAIELSSGWDAADCATAREAFANRHDHPGSWRDVRAEFCHAFSHHASIWKQCAT